jgi:acyl-coenzyme A synthetase/AMP-(fatty) acid ligase
MIGLLHPASANVALIVPDGGAVVTHAELHTLVLNASVKMKNARGQVALVLAQNNLATVLALLTLRVAGCVVILADAALSPVLLDALISTYSPELIVGVADDTGDPLDLGLCTVRVLQRAVTAVAAPHPSLGLCLATSGSTGSPKLVRLSDNAVVANARAIAQALHITADNRAITCLPLHYAYGLSILTSHLVAGASVVISAHGIMASEFWRDVQLHHVSTLAGVPYTYQMLERLGLERVIPPGVRVMTQAGGKLADASAHSTHAFMAARDGKFHVMYGQTEATARIAVMPHHWLPGRVGAAGRAVPGGTIEAHDPDGYLLPAGVVGDIVYRGPNVMLGYALSRNDLALGDSQLGVLRTGDLGSVDADGCLRITGRAKRIGKLFGVRVDLDMVECFVGAEAPAAVLEGDNSLIVFATGDASFDVSALRSRLAAQLRVQQRVIDVRRVTELPRTASGKVNYPLLRASA